MFEPYDYRRFRSTRTGERFGVYRVGATVSVIRSNGKPRAAELATPEAAIGRFHAVCITLAASADIVETTHSQEVRLAS